MAEVRYPQKKKGDSKRDARGKHYPPPGFCDGQSLYRSGDDVIQRVGLGGNFLDEESTAVNIRTDEWLIPKLDDHKIQKVWENSGRKDILDEAREKADQVL